MGSSSGVVFAEMLAFKRREMGAVNRPASQVWPEGEAATGPLWRPGSPDAAPPPSGPCLYACHLRPVDGYWVVPARARPENDLRAPQLPQPLLPG
jgi:hypothetical protein